MRRVLRFAFVLLVVATLVAPLQLGETIAAPVPVCCLGQGEHHCLGQMLGGPEFPILSASSKCPYAPMALAALHGPQLAPPVRSHTTAPVATLASAFTESHSLVLYSPVDTRPERGPPAFSLN